MERLLISAGIGIPTRNTSPLLGRNSPFLLFPRRLFPTTAVSAVFKTSSVPDEEDEVLMFLKDREENGDFISKFSDSLWKRGGGHGLILDDPEDGNAVDGNLRQKEMKVLEDGSSGGFLKLTKTQEWIAGDSIAPVNKRSILQKRQNDSEKRKKLNFLKYEALKRELLVLTAGIGVSCSGYCLLVLSVQASISYGIGVLLSCLYLQLLYNRADKLSKEEVPSIFLKKKTKKIGIRGEDLENLLERTIKGSSMALSSPRLALPAIVYGFSALSHQFLDGIFSFQLVPAMFGLFAYKAAALVQVYRDNEDLRLIFSEDLFSENDDDDSSTCNN